MDDPEVDGGLSDEEQEQEQEDEEMDEVEGMEDDDEAGNLQELEQNVESNIFNYDAHIALIAALRRSGELEKVGAARERMHSIYPLSPELWLDWIKDESGLDDEEVQNVRNLFERAVQDYVSFDVWFEYVQWSCGSGLSPEEVRKVFERALTAVGLHVGKGALLWDAYRIFEEALLTGMESKGDTKAAEDQRNRMDKLYCRQLSIPLNGMDQTMSEYLDFLKDAQPSPATKASYEAAKKKLEALMAHEDAVEAAGKNSYDAYKKYIDFELKESKDNPSRIQSLFERAVTDNCLNSNLWLEYLKWLDRYLKIGDVILPVYARAVRNCSWAPGIWNRYLMALERAGRDWTEVEAILQKAMEGGFKTATEGIQLWLCYVYMTRRKLIGQTDQDWTPVIGAFEKGAEFLKTTFGDRYWDPEFYYRKSWAYFEASRGRMTRSRELWQEIMSEGNGPYAAFWMEYLQMERQFGEEKDRMKRCRKILTQAVNSVIDQPDFICHTFLQFEREEGTLADLDAAELRVEARMNQIKEQQQKADEGKQKQKQKWEKQSPRKQNGGQWGGDTGKSGNRDRDGLKRRHEASKEERPKPKRVDQEGFAVPFAAPPPVKKSRPETRSEVNIEPSKPFDLSDTSKYDRTVFISNLDFKLEDPEEKLRPIFAAVGPVAEVRLVRHITGRFKGYGFVEFTSSAPLEAALQLDRAKIEGRPMYVSRCEDKKQKPTMFPFQTKMEKNKLFVKNIPFSVLEKELEGIFRPHGPVKSIRLGTKRSGASKGFAYVEFDDETSASRALVNTDGIVLQGKRLSVAISDPPARNAPPKSIPTEEIADPAARKSHSSKLQLPLLTPRSLKAPPTEHKHHHPTAAAAAAAASSSASTTVNGTEAKTVAGATQQAKMSNEQFRQMLLKK